MGRLKVHVRCLKINGLPFAVKASCKNLNLVDNSIWDEGWIFTRGFVDVSGENVNLDIFQKWLKNIFEE